MKYCIRELILLSTILGALAIREEVQLLRDILTDYDPAARPVNNLTDAVDVKMGVALFQIQDLDEKNQYIRLNAWFQFRWNDPMLTWNSSIYGGLRTIRIPSSRVWIPDIVLYNSVDETKPATSVFPETNTIVSMSGDVLWVIPAMIKSSCAIDVTHFPFDEQRCPIKFGSWTYDGFQLDLDILQKEGDLGKYTPNGEWDLIEMPAYRNVEYYSCCLEPYVDVNYTIVLRRKPMFYTFNLVFPCVLLTVLGTFVFCLPPESGEKVSLGVTVLLAMTVYQLLIADSIPPTSEVVPLIGKYFGVTICLLSMSTAATVISVRLHFGGDHGNRLPQYLRTIFLYGLSRFVGVPPVGPPPPTQTSNGVDLFSGNAVKDPTYSAIRSQGGLHDATAGSIWRTTGSSTTAPEEEEGSHSIRQLTAQVRRIEEGLKKLRQNDAELEHCKSEWRHLAIIVDRILLLLFATVNIITGIVVFGPHWQ